MIRFRRCGHCGSSNVRRAMARTDWQRFVRALTPFRRFQCLDCKHRGWLIGALAQSESPASTLDLPARPVEERDFEELADVRFRFVLRLLLATGLGVLLAYWIIVHMPQ